MEKRVSVRGIIIEDDKVLLIFRRRIDAFGSKREYYVIPGGGVEEKETIESCIIREMKEELSVDVRVLGYLGREVDDFCDTHFFHCEITNGVVKLGGPEEKRNCKENYYEIVKKSISEIENEPILSVDKIIKAENKEYIEFEEDF